MQAQRVFALNVHAAYACRHSGACCTAGWSIPVEPHLRPVIQAEWLVPVDGACPEYDRDARRCRIQRRHGEATLPRSCFHFPRRALIDERGTFVTLSHFCPTAARMLVNAGAPLAIVAGPVAFPPQREYEGLDGRGEWPPLLRPGVLFDHGSYGRWEAFLVDTLGDPPGGIDDTLTRVAVAADRLRQWTVDRGPLAAWVEGVLSSPAVAGLRPPWCARFDRLAGWRRAAACVPEDLAVTELPASLDDAEGRWVAPEWDQLSAIVLRYLGTKAFASWSAYQGHGVRTQVAELLVAASVLRAECARACHQRAAPLDRESITAAIRASDWLLMHLMDRPALMADIVGVEREPEVCGA